MYTRQIILPLTLSSTLTLFICAGGETDRLRKGRINQPLRFEASPAGQNSFRVNAFNYRVRLNAGDVTIASPSASINMKLQNADSKARNLTGPALPGTSNYFTGNKSAGWRRNVSGYANITYQNVYPNIDVTYYGHGRSLEYDFILRPGSDLGNIRMKFEGHQGIRVDKEGALTLDAGQGELRHRKPVAFQEIDGRRTPVNATYVLSAANEVGFKVDAYDRQRTLYIDPIVDFSTYLGGNGADNPTDVTVDVYGSIYVTGPTNSSDFPLARPLQKEPAGGLFDCFVSKFSADGSRLIYSTYFGGSGTDDCRGIAVDALGHAYIAGQTLSTDLPVVNAIQRELKGDSDGMLAKISADGSSLLFSTYIGGSGADSGNRVKLDAWGSVYLVGETNSQDFPTKEAFQPAFGGGNADGYVVKLRYDGREMIYGTYLGGTGTDRALGLAVDQIGHAHVTGETTSTDYPTERPLQANLKQFSDAYVTKFRPDGKGLVFSTYLGGIDNEFASGIALDVKGDVYVTGHTASTDFPIVNAYQPALRGFDAFVTKIRADGSEFVYSTFLGGTGQDQGIEIAVDLFGQAYVTGQTRSLDFPNTNAVQAQYGGGTSDAFVAKFSSQGKDLLFSTYLGGEGSEEGRAITALALGDVIVTGTTASADFPVKSAFQGNYSGFFNDGYLVRISTRR